MAAQTNKWNPDPLKGRSIENVMSSFPKNPSDMYQAGQSNVYDMIYRSIKEEETTPEFDKQIKKLQQQRNEEIKQAIALIEAKYDKLEDDAERLLGKQDILTRDEFLFWYSSLDETTKLNLKKLMSNIRLKNQKCKCNEDMFSIDDEIEPFESLYGQLAIQSNLISSDYEFTNEFIKIEREIITSRSKSASED